MTPALMAGIFAGAAFAIGFLCGYLHRGMAVETLQKRAHALAAAVRGLLHNYEVPRGERRSVAGRQAYFDAITKLQTEIALYDSAQLPGRARRVSSYRRQS